MEIIRRETDYALRAVVKLQQEGGLMSTRLLSEQCDIPLDYIRKIMLRLAKAGIVKATRGKTGGFALLKPAYEISLKDIIRAMQGPLILNKCSLYPEECHRHTICMLHPMMSLMQKELDTHVTNKTLKDVIDLISSRNQDDI